MPKTPFYLTTALPYVNGLPHLGHAYEAIATDVIARFKRLDGYDVFFLTGTDEHGQKVESTARANGKDPKAFCDEIAAKFQAMDRALNISNDGFIRTTEERHYRASQELWSRLEAKGDIYPGHYSGWYSPRDEAFFGEDELVEREGGKFAPTGNPVEWVEEESYFFRLSAYQDRLLAHYEANPDFILPKTRRNEVVSFVSRGLKDLSISRASFKWGVPVPGNERHVMYVWLDALTNYITAVGYPDRDGEMFRKYWPADLHIIGNDILRFHAVYWPAFLMSGDLPLPKRVFSHGMLLNDGQKMSKSLGNVISPEELIETYGVDQTRYFLMREVAFGSDGSISSALIATRINSDLANDFGNLAQRSLSMIAKNCNGTVPEPEEFSSDDKELLKKSEAMLELSRQAMEAQTIHDYLAAAWRVIADANQYFARSEPWALKKTNPARMGTVLYVTAEVVRRCAILVQAVVPEAAGRLLDQLAAPEEDRDFASITEKPLVPGTALPSPEGVFPRHVVEEGKA